MPTFLGPSEFSGRNLGEVQLRAQKTVMEEGQVFALLGAGVRARELQGAQGQLSLREDHPLTDS